MLDNYNRIINYLRISVTDRCNLRCTYCMPEEGVKLLSHNDLLSYDEIFEIVKYGVTQGIEKVRITGGEPLVRKGIVSLIEKLAKIEGIKDLAMTTNGILLPFYAKQLKCAGLHRVNISLDTIDKFRFRQISRIGEIDDVFKGIDAALDSGLTPVKINCVVKKSKEEADAQQVLAFCKSKNIEVRFIKEMDLEKGIFGQVIGGDGGNCGICNRLRITSTGKIKPCLFSDIEYDIRKTGIEKAFELALNSKPKNGVVNKQDKFSNIGG